MTSPDLPILPAELETVFSTYQNDPIGLIHAFMPIFCDLVKADRIFVGPRNPHTRVCTMLRWRRNENIPWPAISTGGRVNGWILEDKWEVGDPLFRAALDLEPSIYVEDLEKAGADGILNLNFEKSYMFHTAFIHGHAHWPPLPGNAADVKGRQFYGSVQPAIFDGSRVWSKEVHELVEKCLIRIAPFMKAHSETAPSPDDFKKSSF